MVKVNQCLLRMICYMLRFFELAQQVIYHNYVAYNFFEQSIFILSYWIDYADSTTVAVINVFFGTTVISSMSTGPDTVLRSHILAGVCSLLDLFRTNLTGDLQDT